jgi:WXG100 family type VII secretion target
MSEPSSHLMVDVLSVESLARSLNASHTSITSTCQMLDTKVQHVLGQWSGEAQQAYAAAQRQCRQELDEMADISQETADLTRIIADDYERVDRTAAARWRA